MAYVKMRIQEIRQLPITIYEKTELRILYALPHSVKLGGGPDEAAFTAPVILSGGRSFLSPPPVHTLPATFPIAYYPRSRFSLLNPYPTSAVISRSGLGRLYFRFGFYRDCSSATNYLLCHVYNAGRNGLTSRQDFDRVSSGCFFRGRLNPG